MSAPVFEFSGIVGGYGSSVILRGIDGGVAPGEALFVLGRNGVGKSTLMKVLMGFLPCLEGSIRLEGRDIAALAAPLFTQGLGRPAHEAAPVYIRNKVAFTMSDRQV